jgi:spore maturation protein CgeB
MKIVLFYHSLVSDWNHGNAHFLRGVATELIERGNGVVIYEPANSWSRSNLIKDYGKEAIDDFHRYYPLLNSETYDTAHPHLEQLLTGADLVIVHEWNEHSLVKQIGRLKLKLGYRLLFHDTHHRAVTERESMRSYDLSNYDGVLAFGEIIRQIYLKQGWTKKAWAWHEAADTRVFKPLSSDSIEGDLVWIGNWGDEERTKELIEFIIEPVKQLRLKAKFYGVRYPEHAKKALAAAGIEYGGWLPNYKAPEVFAKYRFTVHVPRRPYVESLPGIPTIRPFEAMACGIPLLTSPWNDAEHLFTPAKDFLTANNKSEMIELMRTICSDNAVADSITESGLNTILRKHTCAHRVNELYGICDELKVNNLKTSAAI